MVRPGSRAAASLPGNTATAARALAGVAYNQQRQHKIKKPRVRSIHSLMLSVKRFRLCLAGVWLLLLCLAAVAQSVAGEIYKWTDAQGNVHFTDQPPADSGASPVEVRVNSVSAPPLDVDAIFPQSETPQRASRKKVVLYSAEWCGYCTKARAYLRQRKVAFTEYDVEKSKQGADEYRRLKGNGVPLIMVGKQRVNGFNKARLDQLLK